MDKVYKRINWNTHACNGSMDSNQYLYSQIARAICEASYEKPLTIEEISLKTGLPTMYIEDEMPRLIGGDAIEKIGNKYAANFIIYRLSDKKKIEVACSKIVSDLSDYYENLFEESEAEVSKMMFYGSDLTMKKLGYIALPASLRGKVESIKNSLSGFEDGPYPPRKDGGYGWFIVGETEDGSESMSPYSSGCNISDFNEECIYYYWIGKYFNDYIYNDGGTRWLAPNRIPQKCSSGVIPEGLLTEEDIIRLLGCNLIKKHENRYKLNFACFTSSGFDEFASLFQKNDDRLAEMLTDLIKEMKKSFVSFVPKRLGSQINQYLSCCMTIIGEVAEELIKRGVLEKPDMEKGLVNGVFYISGKYKLI